MLAPGLIVHPRGIIPDAPREEDVTRLEASLMDRLHIDEKTLALLVERARNRQLTEQDLIDSVEHLQERISQSTQENS